MIGSNGSRWIVFSTWKNVFVKKTKSVDKRLFRVKILISKVQPERRWQAKCACTGLAGNLRSEGAHTQKSRVSGGERVRRVFANGACRLDGNKKQTFMTEELQWSRL